jgi:sugar phosphate isomerase/epimerase
LKALSLDILTVMGMAPAAHIRLAAKLGCRYIGMQVTPAARAAELYANWSLRNNPGLMREVKAALLENGVSIRLGEGFLLLPKTEMHDLETDLDLLADAGADRANICILDEERSRAWDRVGAFAELSAARGMRPLIEFVPTLAVGDLTTALHVIRYVGRADLGLVIDTMHLFRSGATVADVAALDPSLIGYVQISDVPWTGAGTYAEEACFNRRCPGDGDLPLKDLMRALPGDVPIGIEIPMRARVMEGEEPFRLLERCVAATCDLLEGR